MSASNAVIEHISATECRLRSVMFFEQGSVLSFDFVISGKTVVHLHGRVVARASNGPRFNYRLMLDRTTPQETDELARMLAQAHQRKAKARSLERAIASIPTTDGPARKSLRVMTKFPVQYRSAKEDFREGKALDVSSGGLALECDVALVAGMTIELKFTLPSDVLSVYPEQTQVLDLKNRTVRQIARPDLCEEFEEIECRARVVSHNPIGNRTYSYGLIFTDLDGVVREEIARYVHAAHLTKRAGK
jgi:hypothetical protein